MTPAQKNHLERIKRAFGSLTDTKYEQGAAEHGGSLWERSAIFLVEEAIKENIDQFTYLVTLRDKLIRDPKNSEGIPEPNSSQPPLSGIYVIDIPASSDTAEDFEKDAGLYDPSK